jgi:hypothetical protein
MSFNISNHGGMKRGGIARMKKTIIQQLDDNDSVYIVATKDGSCVIRVSGHLPDPEKLRDGGVTRNCKNIYLLLVKNFMDKTQEENVQLARLIELKESCNIEEKMQGDVELNNWIVEIGNNAKIGMNYLIIDGNSEHEIKATIKTVMKKLKTTIFIPLKYI